MASFFSDLFGGGAEKDAAQQDKGALALYQNQALPALQQAYGTGTSALQAGIQGYQPLANLGATYSSGAGTLMGGLGIGTPQQVAQAQQQFTAGPGYQFQVEQANQAAQRAAAAGGMSNSGNALVAADRYAQGLANTTYQQWLQNLQNAGGMGLNATNAAAAGQMAGQQSLAGLAQNYGQNQAGIYGNVAQGDIAANNLAAAGEAAGAKNLLGAGLSLATLGLGGNPFGGSLTGGSSGGGGSSLFSSVSNLFKPGSLSGGFGTT